MTLVSPAPSKGLREPGCAWQHGWCTTALTVLAVVQRRRRALPLPLRTLRAAACCCRRARRPAWPVGASPAPLASGTRYCWSSPR